jgi:murein peptide amidase A
MYVPHFYSTSVIRMLTYAFLVVAVPVAFPDALDRTVAAELAGPLIRPWNYDSGNEWDYTLRRGVACQGAPVQGAIWNHSDGTVVRIVDGCLRLPAGDALATQTRVSSGLVGPQAVGPQTEVLGYSVQGVPVVAHHFGRGGERVLIFGGIHGNEENSAELARLLVEELQRRTDVWSDRRVTVLPVANPDGVVKRSRTNSRGVDLNRNFPAKNWAGGDRGPNYGGDAAASEPETQVLVRLVETFSPERIVSIHAIFGGRECNNYDGPGADLAQVMAGENKYPVKKSIGYPTPGSFGTWAGNERQIPTITLELPQGLPGGDCWDRNRTALLAAIRGR